MATPIAPSKKVVIQIQVVEQRPDAYAPTTELVWAQTMNVETVMSQADPYQLARLATEAAKDALLPFKVSDATPDKD